MKQSNAKRVPNCQEFSMVHVFKNVEKKKKNPIAAFLKMRLQTKTIQKALAAFLKCSPNMIYRRVLKNMAIDPQELQSWSLGRVCKHGYRKRGCRPNGPIATFFGSIAAFQKCGYRPRFLQCDFSFKFHIFLQLTSSTKSLFFGLVLQFDLLPSTSSKSPPSDFFH